MVQMANKSKTSVKRLEENHEVSLCAHIDYEKMIFKQIKSRYSLSNLCGVWGREQTR